MRRAVPVAIALLACAVPGLAQQATIGLNFQGTTYGESTFIPPDTMGTVGPDHVVELINGRYKVYDKTTGSALASSTLGEFWTAAGADWEGSWPFDPRVVYDPYAQRYYALSVDTLVQDNPGTA